MLQTPKRIPSHLRCALTGVPIRRGDVVLVIGAGTTKRTTPRYLEPVGDIVSAPQTLHKSAWRGGTEGVGLAYSVLMAQYLALVGSEIAAEDRRDVLAWWRSDYGIRRVREGLLEKLPDYAANHVLEVVLTCHREEADPADIAARFQHSEQWVLGKIDWCMRLAHGIRT